MEEMITGYQYGPIRGEFRCVYEFPNNLDKEDIHMPPYTTLTPPPADIPAGMIACWNGQEWSLEPDAGVVIKVPEIPKADYGKLLPEFAAEQVHFGLWTQEQYAHWQVAYAAEQERLAQEEAAATAEFAAFMAEKTGKTSGT